MEIFFLHEAVKFKHISVDLQDNILLWGIDQNKYIEYKSIYQEHIGLNNSEVDEGYFTPGLLPELPIQSKPGDQKPSSHSNLTSVRDSLQLWENLCLRQLSCCSSYSSRIVLIW